MFFSVQSQSSTNKEVYCNLRFTKKGVLPQTVKEANKYRRKKISTDISISDVKNLNEKAWKDLIKAVPFSYREQFVAEIILFNSSKNKFTEEFTDTVNELIEAKAINYFSLKNEVKKIHLFDERPSFLFSDEHQEVFLNHKMEPHLERKLIQMLERSELSAEMKKKWEFLFRSRYPGDKSFQIIEEQLRGVLPEEEEFLSVADELFEYLQALKPIYRQKVAKDIIPILSNEKEFSTNWLNEILSQKTRLILGIGERGYNFFKEQHILNNAFDEHRRKLTKKKIREKKLKQISGEQEVSIKTKARLVYQELVKKNKSQTVALTSFERQKILEEAYEYRYQLREIRNTCQRNSQGLSKKKKLTTNDKTNLSRFRKFKLFMSSSFLAGSYYYLNPDAPWLEEFPNEAHLRLELELRWLAVYELLNTHVISQKGMPLLPKYFTFFMIEAMKDFLYSGEIAYRFTGNDEEINREYQKLKESPYYKEKLEQLVKTYKEQEVARKIYYHVIDLLKSQKIPTGETLLEAVKTEEDLEKPEIEEAVSRLLGQEYYQNLRIENSKDSPEFVKKLGTQNTGFAYTDLLTFNRKFGSISNMKSVLVGLYMFNMLCKNSLNPTLSYVKAGAVVILDNLLTKPIYYGARDLFVPSSVLPKASK